MPTTSRVGNNSASIPQGRAVGWIVEGRHEHDAVADVEVHVARRQTLSVEEERPRQRNRDHPQRAPAQVAHCPQAPEVVGQRRVVVVAGVGFDGGHDGVRAHETRQVVDMAVRVVTGDAPAQPQHPLDPERLLQHAFERGT